MYNAKNNRKNERIKGKNRRNGRKQMKGWVRKDNNDRIPAVNRLERKKCIEGTQYFRKLER